MLALAGIFSVLSIVGVIWIAVIAIQSGDIAMGVISLFCGIVAIVYGVQHMEKCKTPLILMVVGIVGSVAANVMGGGFNAAG